MNDQTTSFNFDEWMQLAKDDPEAFEQQRLNTLQNAISSSSNSSQKRLKGLQWQIDQVCKTSRTPMAACLNISRMMWQTVQGEEGLVDTLNQLTGKTPPKRKVTHSADVVPFRTKSAEKSEQTG